MIIGVPREIKSHEYRVALTPEGTNQLVQDGHQVLIEPEAGAGSGFDDAAYQRAGAAIALREQLFGQAELLLKVKEPLQSEYDLLRQGQILFTYLHLAPNRELTGLLVQRGVTAFGYETLELNGTTPLLTPMSEIAGRMAPLVGAWYLQRPHGGTGVLPGGVAGVRPARAVIVGAGVVGSNAVRVALGIGMDTVVLNRGSDRLRQIDQEFHGAVRTLIMNPTCLAQELVDADLVVGALYRTGARTPVVIDRAMLGHMKHGAVLVDVSIDQGGCCIASRPTTHEAPVFTEQGVIHYCVANMPGAYPHTATLALTSATLPYIRTLAKWGVEQALQHSPELTSALNIHQGAIRHPTLCAAT